MSALSTASERAPGPDDQRPPASFARSTSALAVLGGLVLALCIVLRFWTRSVLWLDEALTVNIAKLPLGDLHAALKQDGAPPLYYLLLHGWIRLFGDSSFAVRSLSGIFGVLALPCAWWSGSRIGRSRGDAAGRITAWAAVFLLASSPYAIRYSTETRMYSLEILLVLLGHLALWRVFERPNIGRMAVLALVTGLLLYNQYWSLYLLAVVGVLLLLRLWRTTGEARTATMAAIVAMVSGGITFLPWLPTFLYQSSHTGTPWGKAVAPPTGAAYAFLDFAGSDHTETWILVQLLIILLLVAVFAKALTRTSLEVQLQTVPGVRWEALVGTLGLVVALTLSAVAGSAVQGRYAAVFFPLVILVAAFAFTVFSDPRVRVGLLVVVVGLGLVGGLRNINTQRAQAGQVAAQINPSVQPGDVVGYCPDQVAPSVNRLLPGGLKQATFPDAASPKLINWVDYAKRNEAASPVKFAAELERLAGPDHKIWMVWSPGYLTLGAKCEQVVAALRANRPGTDLVSPDETLFEREGLVRFDPKPAS